MKSRLHHFHMKYLLVQIALQSTAAFFERFGPGGDGRYLHDLWAAMGQDMPQAERVSNEGAEVWHAPAGDGQPETVVLTLPVPLGSNEAWFVGVLRQGPDSCRVFCLERAGAPAAQEHGPVLAEFAPNGRMNWGQGCTPQRDAFIERIRALAGDAQARPLSFVEMRLA